MAVQLKYGYDKSMNGARIVALNNEAFLISSLPKVVGDDLSFNYPVRNIAFGDYVLLTGVYVYFTKSQRYYVTRSGGYITYDIFSNYGSWQNDWKQDGFGKKSAEYSQTQAQALVNKIIKNNKIIIANNLLCARFASKLTEAQKSQVRELQNRLQARNNALQAGQLTTNVQTSYPAGYAELSAYLDALMAGETIGLATWAIVVIAATVIAATATAAYFAYKAYADESERDVKYSKELTAILTSKLTEEEYQMLLNETKGIVTKARIKQSLSSYGKALTIAGLLVGGALLYKYFKNKA